MENSKIILGIILIATIFSCKKNDYIKVKYDVYERNDSLFIKNTVPNMNKEGDSLTHYAYSVELEGRLIEFNDLADLRTFSKQHIPQTLIGKYYKDKNYFYIYNESPVYFPEINAIKYINNSIQFLGNDYYKIDNKIYFQSKQMKNADFISFKITDFHTSGYYFAKDKNHYYYKDSIVSEKYFNEVKNAIK